MARSVAQRFEVSLGRLAKRNADVAPRHTPLAVGCLLEIPGLSGSTTGSDSSAEEGDALWPPRHSLGRFSTLHSRTMITCHWVRA